MSHALVPRREALRRLALGGLGAATAPLWVEKLAVLAAERGAQHPHGAAAPGAAAWAPRVLDAHQNRTVILLGELIIPETETAGATAAKVNEFVDAVLADADRGERQTFLRGLAWMDARSRELFGSSFVGCAPEQQHALLTILSAPENRSLQDQIGVEFFRAIKAMTITGYYTSEVGMREELGDDGTRFFAEFEGCDHPEHQQE